MNIFTRQKLFFDFGPDETELSLCEALVGGVGKVMLGLNGVGLWTPHMGEIEDNREYVCDMRFQPLTDQAVKSFHKQTKGLFLPARIVVLRIKGPKSIEWGLKNFDYVLVPSNHVIKNTPKDFRKRVLGYNAKERNRCEPALEDY